MNQRTLFITVRIGALPSVLALFFFLSINHTHAQTQGAPDDMTSLIELAEAKFGTLSADHPLRKLIGAISDGEFAVFGSRSGNELNPEIPIEDWDTSQVLNSKHVSWLCTDPKAAALVTHRGIAIIGARFDEVLDLSFTEIKFPVSLIRCSLPNGLVLYQAEVKTLVLSGSQLGRDNPNGQSLTGHLLTVNGHLLLAKGFLSTGVVDLSAAQVRGDIDLGGATMMNEDKKDPEKHGVVLDLAGVRTNGSIFMYQGFSSYGAIRFNDTEIGGQLLCTDARLRGALSADGSRIESTVAFKEGFVSDGEIRFVGATIEGNLECADAKFNSNVALNGLGMKLGGTFYSKNCSFSGELRLDGARIGGGVEIGMTNLVNPTAKTVSMEKATVGGAFFFADNSVSKGEISLAGAVLEQSVEFRRARLGNSGKRVLFADFVEIGGAILFISGVEVFGEIRFSSARIHSNIEFEDVLLSNGQNATLTFHNAVVGGAVLLRNGLKSSGVINLIGANVSSDLDLRSASVDNPRGHTLLADRSIIGGSMLFGEGFRSNGEIVLFGAEIAANLDFTGAVLENAGGPVLNAANCDVGGSVKFKDGFVLDGMVDFTGSKVGTFFRLSGRKLLSDDRFALDIRHARVRALFDDTKSWPTSRPYNIDGFTYDTLADGAPRDVKSRISWVEQSHSIDTSFHPGSYTQLATVFEKSGDDAGARDVRIARERARSQQTAFFPLRIWYFILDWAVAYGYKPWFSIGWAILSCAVATGIFYRAEANGQMVPSDNAAYEKGRASRDYPDFHPLVYAVDTFLPIIDLQQAKFWRPISAQNPRFHVDWLWCVQWSLIALGWLLSTLLVASVSGIIKS